MSRKFQIFVIRDFLSGTQNADLAFYVTGGEGKLLLEQACNEARAYLAQKYTWIYTCLPELLRNKITVLPMNRPKNSNYTNKTVRGRYRFHKGKIVEGTPTEPNPALREANKRKGPRK